MPTSALPPPTPVPGPANTSSKSNNDNSAASNATKDKDASKKRSRYTSIACNECKRRKIKCNGEKPCERCGNQELNCVYESPNFQDSEEYRRMCSEIERLQGQVKELFDLVKEMREERQREGAARGVSGSLGAGSTLTASSAHGLGVDSGVGAAGTGARVVEATAYGGDAAVASGRGRVQVDMTRHDGSIDFVHDIDTRPQELDRLDPFTTISLTYAKSLMMVYTEQVHPIYPFLELPAVLRWLEKNITFHPEAAGDARRQIGGHMEVTRDTAEAFWEVEPMVCQMALAVAAYTQSADSELAQRLYANVQHMYTTTQNVPLGYAAPRQGGLGEACMRPPWRAMIKGMRLRLLEGLWQFQHGNAEAAQTAAREAMMVCKSLTLDISNDPDPNSEAAATCLKLGSTIYSMYWRWTLLTKPSPRYDTNLEKSPPRTFEVSSECEKSDDSPVCIAFFELAKLCSITCFAFERPFPETIALKDTKWTREQSVEYVHRWQGGFPLGLRSLAAQRPAFLASKSIEERITLAAVFLHANHLRISACWYKRSSSGAADRYNGPISELYDSAKWARESIEVLWGVHEVGGTWASHAFLFNSFLLAFSGWVYDLLNAGAIRLSDEVKVSLQKTLVLMEAYCEGWEEARGLLGKLRESRRYGAFA